jgi:hypothetical protein
MTSMHLAIAGAALLLLAATSGCNPERKQECERFAAAMKPLEQATPSAEDVDRVRAQIEGLKLGDQTLGIYAKNYVQTLTVLASTLRLKNDPEAPDGTDDVIKTRLRAARTDADDVARYCAE